ncbi:MAG: (d)CMP kinase [Anaerovoracaceae bacterium]|jgi:cytidylate kinase
MMRIAIDGPGGAGKSTIAKAVAKALQIDYVDTGAMYRAVGYKIIREGIPLDDEKRLEEMLERTDIRFSQGSIYLDGEDVTGRIRSPEISAMASACSAVESVRKKLVSLQREIGKSHHVVMDGRDIASNVMPYAEYKFFMTADPKERARRRYLEMKEKGSTVTMDQVLEDINQRDHNDMTRKLNPLRKAEDAVEIDTTRMSIEEVIERILKEVK